MTQKYAYTTPYSQGDTISDEHCKTLVGWYRQTCPHCGRKFQRPDANGLARHEIVPVTPYTPPADAVDHTETTVLMTDSGPVQQGTARMPDDPATDDDRWQKLNELETAREAEELAGTVWNDIPISTSKETQEELGKALGFLQVDPAFTITWEFSQTGMAIQLDGDMIKAIAAEVFGHVQATRNKKGQLNEQVWNAVTLGVLQAIVW